MFDEEELPKIKKQALSPLKLDDLSVADMNEYIASLKEEIVRVEKAIAQRANVRGAAEALFS